MWPNSTGSASGACAWIKSTASLANPPIADSGKRDVELQRGPVHAEHLGERLANLPQPLLRSDIHADRGLAAHSRAVEQVGEPFGLVVVGGQLHQQQPVALDR